MSVVDTSAGIVVDRPYGGLGVLWRKSLNMHISIGKHNQETRMIGVYISKPMSDVFILNVYLPTDTDEHLDDFRD